MQSSDASIGRYSLVSCLHHGPATEIFRARIEGAFGFEKLIAIKRLSPEAAGDEQARRRFIREAMICSKLCHPNAVGVYDFYQKGMDLFLAMELVDGVSLEEILEHQRRTGQPFPLPATLFIAAQLLDALDYVHKARDPLTNGRLELVHRHLTPENVLIDRSGVVKLVGFDQTQLTPIEDEIGLEPDRWSAPELWESSRSRMTAAADLFSLGAVLFEMLTLSPLLLERNPAALRAEMAELDIEERFEELESGQRAMRPLLRRALARLPGERYPTAGAMARDLRPHLWPSAAVQPPDQCIREAVEAALLLRELSAPDTEEVVEGAVLLETGGWTPWSTSSGRPFSIEQDLLHGDLDLDEEDEDELDELDLEDDPIFGTGRALRRASRTVNLASEPWARSSQDAADASSSEAERDTRVLRLEAGDPFETVTVRTQLPEPTNVWPLVAQQRAAGEATGGKRAGAENDEPTITPPTERRPLAGRPPVVASSLNGAAPDHPADAESTDATLSTGGAAMGQTGTWSRGLGTRQDLELALGSVPELQEDPDPSLLVFPESVLQSGWGTEEDEQAHTRMQKELEDRLHLDPDVQVFLARTADLPEEEAAAGPIRSLPGLEEAIHYDPPGFLDQLLGGSAEPEVLVEDVAASSPTAFLPSSGHLDDIATRETDARATSAYRAANGSAHPARGQQAVHPAYVIQLPRAPRPGNGAFIHAPPVDAARIEIEDEDDGEELEFESVTDPGPVRPPAAAPEPGSRRLETASRGGIGMSLVFLEPPGGLRCPVPDSGLTLGRAHGNDVVLADLEVAPRHAAVIWEAGQWWLRAQRGEVLRIDGQERHEIELEPGRILQIGRSRFLVVEDAPPEVGGVLDYHALEAELVDRFPEEARDERFRVDAGLSLPEELLKSSPRVVWSAALRRLREAPDPRQLRRMLDVLSQVDPEAPQVNRARRCLLALEKWA